MTKSQFFHMLPRHLLMMAVFVVSYATVANAVPQSATPSDPQTITVSNTYRSLAEITTGKLQEVYGVPITFEDSRYLHASQMTSDAKGQPRLKPDAFAITY